jgi:LPXTG-motif cell wall-anchored protein
LFVKRLLFLATGLVAIGSSVGAAYAQATTTVVMTNFAFTPSTVTVSGRSTWTLENPSGAPHNVHIEGNGVSMDVKPDGPVVAGANFTATVTLPAGSYTIWCPVGMHRANGMEGTLTVAAAGGAAQVPRALPRTGEAESTAPLAAAGLLAGAVLIGLGLFGRRSARRRS